ncbi:putative aldouronate transport system permease protein [Paenibacillus sp. yr247]|uniref:carbohydrate ABC transporter permease n=1 Tax=Paenibacillus sp. yr247 TaxID=1761880 RepID=UPI000884DC21|nr:carbohydrate ABC transporter permease [Paenibacillus sp. yr247]SDO37578.1 putative aldouronate transport system permease protein [Paenibacillus sp. yr247]
MPIYKSEKLFHTINGIFFIALSLIMVAPLINLAAISLSSHQFADTHQVYFWPKGFNFDVYRYIFQQPELWKSLSVTIYITVVGTIITLFFTSTIAFSLSRPFMPGKTWILKGIIITFIFSVPLIPYYLVVRSLGMENTLWALMIPNALGAFNVIIMKTFFQGLSAEIFDAAYMDGCSEFGIYGRIAVPLSMPAVATIGLFHAVGQWNSYFWALIFIRAKSMYPLQIILKRLIVEDDAGRTFGSDDSLLSAFTPEQMKAGIILFATIPILLVYPSIQRYFVKGAMVGSLKE